MQSLPQLSNPAQSQAQQGSSQVMPGFVYPWMRQTPVVKTSKL
jgi:hypothetical protein